MPANPVHNPHTEQKDLVRLPGLVAVAYQHETRGAGSAPAHPRHRANRQARADGVMVSIDGTSVYHEAKAAGVIARPPCAVNCTVAGSEWAPVDPTGMAEVAGVDRATITAWSRRSSAGSSTWFRSSRRGDNRQGLPDAIPVYEHRRGSWPAAGRRRQATDGRVNMGASQLAGLLNGHRKSVGLP